MMRLFGLYDMDVDTSLNYKSVDNLFPSPFRITSSPVGQTTSSKRVQRTMHNENDSRFVPLLIQTKSYSDQMTDSQRRFSQVYQANKKVTFFPQCNEKEKRSTSQTALAHSEYSFYTKSVKFKGMTIVSIQNQIALIISIKQIGYWIIMNSYPMTICIDSPDMKIG